MEKFNAIFTKDLYKKRKKYQDVVIMINNLTRKVNISEANDDNSGPSKQLCNSVVNVIILAQLLSFSEVKIAGGLLTIQEKYESSSSTSSVITTTTIVPKSTGNNPNNSFKPPAKFVSKSSIKSLEVVDEIEENHNDDDVGNVQGTSSQNINQPSTSITNSSSSRIIPFVCPSSTSSGNKRSNSSSTSSNSNSSGGDSKIIFTLKTLYNQSYRNCQIDLTFQNFEIYAKQFYIALLEELQLSLASCMSTVESRVLKALGIDLDQNTVTSTATFAPSSNNDSNKNNNNSIKNNSNNCYNNNNNSNSGSNGNKGPVNNRHPQHTNAIKPSIDSVTEKVRGLGRYCYYHYIHI